MVEAIFVLDEPLEGFPVHGQDLPGPGGIVGDDDAALLEHHMRQIGVVLDRPGVPLQSQAVGGVRRE